MESKSHGRAEAHSSSIGDTSSFERLASDADRESGHRRLVKDWAGRAFGVAHSADFVRLWAAQAVSQVGTQFSEVALPLLAALSLGATPLAVGVLAAAAGLPHLLFGLFAGAWVDRLRRRPMMIVADLARFLLLATIPLAAWIGVLRIELLIGVAFLVETFTVFFDLAYLAYVPSIVRRDRLVEANSRLEASASASQVIGPAFGGALVNLLGAANAMLVDAVSYLASALLLARIERPEEAPVKTAEAGIVREIRDGLSSVWRDPTLRALALASSVVSLGGYLFLSIYVLYLTRSLGLNAGAVGFVFATGGIGALLGSLLATPARMRWGAGPTILGSLFLFGLFGLTVPLAIVVPDVALPLILAAEFLQWLTLVVYDVNAVSLRQEITPSHVLGRVSGSMRFIGVGMRPVGALLGGFLGSRIGLPATLAVGALGMFAAFAPLLGSPIPRMTATPAACSKLGHTSPARDV
jgi:predicted MFS family arabinose efflux permease